MALETYGIDELQALQGKVLDMVEKYKDDLHHVLRYYNFSYIVPWDVEGVTKYIALHEKDVVLDQEYTFVHKDTFMKNTNTQFVIDSRIGTTYTIKQRIGSGEEKVKVFSLVCSEKGRDICYNGHHYRSLPQSGTVYQHLITQYEDIKTHTEIDLQAGAISQKEKLCLEIIHLFHDIPEMGHLELCNNKTELYGKTDNDRSGEKERGVEIIDTEQTLNNREKIILKHLYDIGGNKKGIFKFYEHLRRTTDDNNQVIENQGYMNNRKKLFGEMSIAFIPEILQEFRLVTGNRVKPIDLPSVKAHLQKHRKGMDAAIHYTENNCMDKIDPQRKSEFANNKQVWEKIKSML